MVVKDIIFLILICLIFPKTIYAYLDPGTGSYIAQIIVASLLGVSYLVTNSRKKIKTFFAGLFSKLQRGKKNNDRQH